MSEFRIKQQLAALETLPVKPFGKAKRILRLSRYVGHGAMRMAQLADWYLTVGDLGRAARFERARHRLVRLHDEIRAQARRVLECGNDRLGYGHTPTIDQLMLRETA